MTLCRPRAVKAKSSTSLAASVPYPPSPAGHLADQDPELGAALAVVDVRQVGRAHGPPEDPLVDREDGRVPTRRELGEPRLILVNRGRLREGVRPRGPAVVVPPVVGGDKVAPERPQRHQFALDGDRRALFVSPLHTFPWLT